TRYGFTTVNSPDMFDLTNRFENRGSMDCPTPQMLEMVAVGAIASTLELRIPTVRTRSRSASQSSVDEVSMSSSSSPRASASRRNESNGRIPRLHSDPSNDGYAPRSPASSTEAEIAW